MMRYQRKWKFQDNITHIKPFVTEINALHSPNSGQQSAISGKLSEAGFMGFIGFTGLGNCLNCDLWDFCDFQDGKSRESGLQTPPTRDIPFQWSAVSGQLGSWEVGELGKLSEPG